MGTTRERIKVTLTREQDDYLRRLFGENYESEKGAEVRRWTMLGFLMFRAGAKGLAGPRVELAEILFAAQQENFEAMYEACREVRIEKLRTGDAGAHKTPTPRRGKKCR